MRTKRFFVLSLLVIMLFSPLATVRAAEATLWLSASATLVAPGSSFDVAIHANTADKEFGSFEFFFNFNPNLLALDTSKGVNGIDKGFNAGNYLVESNQTDIGQGVFRIAGICSSACAKGADAQLLVLHFKSLPTFTSGRDIIAWDAGLITDTLGIGIQITDMGHELVVEAKPVVHCTTCYVNCGTCPVTDVPPTGSLDYADAKTVSGWAFDQNKGENPVEVRIYADSVYLGQVTANLDRSDLSANLLSSKHGFSFSFPNGLPVGTHNIRAYALNDGNDIHPELNNSPKTVTVAVVDNTPPSGVLTINDGVAETSSQSVLLMIEAEDLSGVKAMKISNTNDFTAASQFAFSTRMSWNLSAGSGLKTVYLWLQDAAGNWTPASSPISDTIGLGLVYPTISNISVSAIGQDTATITWQAQNADYCEVRYGLGDSLNQVADALDGTAYKAVLGYLSADTTYHYYISCDSSNSNNSVSSVSSFKTQAALVIEAIEPNQIKDLSAEKNGPNSVILSWTSPGDDEDRGVASQYDIRYSKTVITEANWQEAIQLSQEPAPESPYTRQSYTVVGLEPFTTYYFIIRTADEVPNWSALSNVYSIKTDKELSADKIPPGRAKKFTVYPANAQSLITWENPTEEDFAKSVLLRSTKPFNQTQTATDLIALKNSVSAATVEATPTAANEALLTSADFQIIYEGDKEYYIDRNLSNGQTYYYALYTMDGVPNYSEAVYGESKPEDLKQVINTLKQEVVKLQAEYKHLANLNKKLVENISLEEAKNVLSYGQYVELSPEGKALYERTMALSKTKLSSKQKYALAYFIEYGTPTTERLGQGERAGVVSSFFAAYKRLPRSTSDYQDVIKIANGRWPRQAIKNKEALAEKAFQDIYKRLANPEANENDDAAVTIMAYGLRPVSRDLAAENRAILTFRTVYGHDPANPNEWDIVRAVAYSGATR
jgi:hypothetical protein